MVILFLRKMAVPGCWTLESTLLSNCVTNVGLVMAAHTTVLVFAGEASYGAHQAPDV